jgi:predicted RNase H-like HicB family nuclease
MDKITLKNNKIVGADLSVTFFYDKENNDVVAAYNPLIILTYGKDLCKAKDMFKEAFELWVESVNEALNAKTVLKNLNWKVEEDCAMFNRLIQ